MTDSREAIQAEAATERSHALILLGLFAAYAIRLYRLGAESLWYDETVSAYMARQPLSDMVAHTAHDIHPPGYYALLHAWSLLSSPFEWLGMEYIFAYPSVWFGMISITLLVPIGRRLVGERPTILAVWLAAVSPFLVWYGQEVRMYTVGGALGMLSLYAAIRYLAGSDAVRSDAVRSEKSGTIGSDDVWWLTVYAAAGASGLYMLYYFAFALISINLAVIIAIIALSRKGVRVLQIVLAWTLAQIALLLLFSPWLPSFIRQISDAPVPPWRETWTGFTAALSDIAASFAAFVVGQSIPQSHTWLWAALAIVLFAAHYGYTKSYAKDNTPSGWVWLPLYTLVPLAMLLIVSALIAPIFHVRYLVTYAPAFSLIAAAGLLYMYSRNRVVLGLVALAIIIGSVYSLTRFWHHPLYRPDDHRAAVARLADEWRPGDAILTNAGWVYTAVDIYWPTTLMGPNDSEPAGPMSWRRLTDSISQSENRTSANAPFGLTTGSIDGDPSLGWGSPDADFYAMSREDTIASLEALAEQHSSIWHYRLYDTVNDPDGAIRDWLDKNLELANDLTYNGNGYLRLQQYRDNSTSTAGAADDRPVVEYESGFTLNAYHTPDVSPAGDTIYVPTEWTMPADGESLPALATSIRLADTHSAVWTQHDEPLQAGYEDQDDITSTFQTLALPVPASTPPGAYEIKLVVYGMDDLHPLTVESNDEPFSAISLGRVEIGLPEDAPLMKPPMTRFDYLELVDAWISTGELAPGQPLHADLIWRPVPSDYTDAYFSRISLVDPDGDISAAWEQPLGGQSYPSSMWPANYPVRDNLHLTLPADIAPGEYNVQLEVLRSSDGQQIPSDQRRWIPGSQPSEVLGTTIIVE